MEREMQEQVDKIRDEGLTNNWGTSEMEGEMHEQVDKIRHEGLTNKMLAASIHEKIMPMPSISGQCIYKVPECLRETKPEVYVPQVVSIGPFHRGKESLKDMEDQKKWYLHALMSQANDPAKILEECANAIRNLEEDARKCYAEPIDLTSDEFVEMMLFDGCFIIELLLIDKGVVCANDNDRIIHTDWIPPKIRSDLLLLENQLPCIVIECLYKQIRRDLEQDAPQSLNDLLIPYFDCYLPVHDNLEAKSDIEGRHILEIVLKHLVPPLSSPNNKPNQTNPTEANNIKPEKSDIEAKSDIEDIEAKYDIEDIESKAKSDIVAKVLKHLMLKYRKCLALKKLPLPQQKKEEDDVGPVQYIQSATQLQEAGVKFQKKSETGNLMDIRFSDDGVLEITPIVFDLHTETVFRNLIAFEQCDVACGTMLTSYVLFLDCLVNSSEDVNFLCQKGIVINWLSDNKATASVINNLSKPWLVAPVYKELSKKVDAYYRTDWHKWRATLKRDYFNTPWTSISVFAAIVLLLLTVTQTIFSVLSYVHDLRKSS